MRVAYLVNQYPKVTHTFIRREILALEALGVEVLRYSVRAAQEAVLDPVDLAEERSTRRILDVGKNALIAALTRTALRRPVHFSRAASVALELSARGKAVAPKHAAYLAEACVLLEWLEGSQVTHLHAHFGTNPAAVALLCHLLGGPPYSFTVHGPEEFDRASSLGLDLKVQHAKFVATISSFGRSQLMRFTKLEDWHKIHVVRCGLDSEWLNAETRAVQPEPRLVSVGRLSEQKGPLLLLDAAARLKQHLDFQLRIIGEGELRAAMERRIKEAGLEQNVSLLGWAGSEQIQEEVQQARALVLPSFAEGLPIVIMEAFALGRPVLSTYVAGIPELIDKKCGWLVPAGSTKQLAEAMRAVLEAPPSELTRKGQVAKKRVKLQHDVAESAQRLTRLFGATEEQSSRPFAAPPIVLQPRQGAV